MIIKVESYKIFSEIYCPIMPAPLELFFGDGCRSATVEHEKALDANLLKLRIYLDQKQKLTIVRHIFPSTKFVTVQVNAINATSHITRGNGDGCLEAGSTGQQHITKTCPCNIQRCLKL